MNSAPPVLTRWLLRVTLPRDAAEFLVGDLDEEFRRLVASDGRSRATRWYRWQAVRTSLHVFAAAVHAFPSRTQHGISGGSGRRNAGGGARRRFLPLGASDLRQILRRFKRRPGTSFTVVATIALGVSATTSVYSVVDGVLSTPPAFGNPNEVVLIWLEAADVGRMPLTPADFRDLLAFQGPFETIAASWGTVGLALGDGRPRAVQAVHVSENYFQTLQIDPMLGDLGRADPAGAIEMGSGLGGDVVISHQLWVSMFGSDPGAVGRHVSAGMGSLRVAGVLPPSVDPNVSGFANTDPLAGIDVWIPVHGGYFAGSNRSQNWVRTLGRLAPGTTLVEAQAELDLFAAELRASSAARRDAGLTVRAVQVVDDLTRDAAQLLQMLMGAVVLVLLVACFNMTAVLLAEMRNGESEAALRTALGESRVGSLARVVAYGATLVFLGGALGIGLSYQGVAVVRSWAPPTLARLDLVTVDRRVLLFGLLTTMSVAMLVSVLPAQRAMRRGFPRDKSTNQVRGGWARRGLICGQIAMSILLSVGAGLFLRSLHELRDVEPGFNPNGVLTFLFVDPRPHSNPQQFVAAAREVATALESVPGVVAAGLTQRMPLTGGAWSGAVVNQARDGRGLVDIETSLRWVSPGFFPAMGIRLVAGRGFDGTEAADAAVIDVKLAEALWPGEDPLGKKLRQSSAASTLWSTVIGVVEHVRHFTVARDALPTLYYPIYAVAMGPRLYGVVRVSQDPAAAFDAVDAALHGIVPRALVGQARTMDELVARDLAATRFAVALLATFAAMAIVLAAVGLYGVLSVWVADRRFEIGVRRALGAEAGGVAGVLGRELASMFLAGTAVGILGVYLLQGTVVDLLYAAAPLDVGVVLPALVALAIGAAAGAAGPLVSALRVSPLTMLRAE